ncbi:substrate-binding domain-containing protein [Aeromonas sanarellii]|nr:substrate-binding domain-containing protein [Aeromonas sanarellii]
MSGPASRKPTTRSRRSWCCQHRPGERLHSGGARKAFLEDPKVDAWVTWADWAKSNPDFGDVVEIEKSLVVYRDVNIALKRTPSEDSLKFANYLKGDTSKNIFQQLGWSDKMIF